MKHEYTDLCQVLDMLNWGKVVKYLPRFNVTQNSVSAPKNAVLGGPPLWLSLVLSSFSQQPGNEKVVQKTTEILLYEKLRPLAAKPIYLGLTVK